MITPPPDPQSGQEILTWARHVNRVLRAIMPRGGRVSTTGSQPSLPRRGSGSGGFPFPRPFKVSQATPGDGGGNGWVQVALYSMLSDGKDPPGKITITGLDAALQLAIDTNPNQYLWMNIDFTALFDEVPGPITASIGHGHDWNGDTGAFWPSAVKYSTDDGTPGGSGGDAPDNRHQANYFAMIAWTYDVADNPWDPYDPPGLMLTPPNPDTGSGGVKLLQVLDTHLALSGGCDSGNQAVTVQPWWAPWYVDPDS